MQDVKAWYESKTVWGAIIAIIASIAGMFGHEISAETQGAIVDSAVAIATGVTAVVGAGIAVYGRIKADTAIGKK